MNEKFHELVVGIAINSMSAEYRDKFLNGFSLALLNEYANVPYIPARFNEPEVEHTLHTYKLALKGRDLHHNGEGNALGEVVNFAKGAVSAKDAMITRYNIAKATHYIIDIATFPHVTEGVWDKYHLKFEDQVCSWLLSHQGIVEELVANYKPDPMRSVQNRVRAIAERSYFDALDFLPTFKRNGQITDLQWATLCCRHIYDTMDWFATFEKQI